MVTYIHNGPTVIIACRNCFSGNRVIRAKRALAMCGKCGWRLVPPTTEAVNFFVRTLVGLSGRLNELRRSLARNAIDANKLERELNTCNALLQSLYNHASRHNIYLSGYFQELCDIEFLSHAIKNEIELKTELTIFKRARWKKALNASIKVTNFVLMLFGLPTFLHPLPEGSEPRLLEDGLRKRYR